MAKSRCSRVPQDWKSHTQVTLHYHWRLNSVPHACWSSALRLSYVPSLLGILGDGNLGITSGSQLKASILLKRKFALLNTFTTGPFVPVLPSSLNHKWYIHDSPLSGFLLILSVRRPIKVIRSSYQHLTGPYACTTRGSSQQELVSVLFSLSCYSETSWQRGGCLTSSKHPKTAGAFLTVWEKNVSPLLCPSLCSVVNN